MAILKDISIRTTFIFSFFIISCNSNNRDSLKKESSTSTATSELGELSKKLNGYWLSDSYLLNIENKKSIYSNREYTTSIFGFILKKEELEKDSAYLHGFTIHEGGYEAPLRYNTQKKQFENNLNKTEAHTFFKKQFELNLADANHLILSSKNKNEKYRKVEDIEFELRKILFEGIYTDRLSQQQFSFDRSGKLKGHPEKHFYNPYYDFGEGLWMDAIFIYDNDKLENPEIYHFKIMGDTMQLFQIEGDIPDYTLGKLRYELIKN